MTCDSGFYDSAFPRVCDGCTSPLCVGVSIHTAIAADNVVNGLWVINPASYTSTEGTISKWLTYVQEDVNSHIVDPTKRELRYGAPQTLRALAHRWPENGLRAQK